jgi:hypothetical protein
MSIIDFKSNSLLKDEVDIQETQTQQVFKHWHIPAFNRNSEKREKKARASRTAEYIKRRRSKMSEK